MRSCGIHRRKLHVRTIAFGAFHGIDRHFKRFRPRLLELVFEMKAVLAHQTSMAYGDLLGSIVANATLITGVSAVIHPIRLDNGLTPYYTAIGVFVLLYLLFILFGRSKSKLTRWEGMILLFVYFGFVVIELARA